MQTVISEAFGSPPVCAARRERGQSLTEFALMLVALTVLLMGVVDLGRAYFTYLALKDAAAEGAYFGSVFPACVDQTTYLNSTYAKCKEPNNIEYRVRNSAPAGGLVNWSVAAVSTDVVLPAVPGRTLTVTVSYSYTLITPLVGAIVGSQQFPLSARSIAVIVSDQLPP